MASIAQITGTLIESGCKHIIPVRVSYDTMVNFSCEPHAETGEKFMRDKYKYCANKDDLLLCVGAAMLEEGEGKFTGKQAYPPVVATLGDVDEHTKRLICTLFFVFDDQLVGEAKENFDLHIVASEQARNFPYRERRNAIPYFRFMGFSCGLGYVHPSNGDTVVSSYIGGLTTVRNGAFPIKTGDLVMWYFDFEAGWFDVRGRRVPPGVNARMGCFPNEAVGAVRDKGGFANRYSAWRRQSGNIGAPSQNINPDKVNHGGKRCMFLPKPFVRDPERDFYMDRGRIFAKALSNARPFDMVDLQICTLPN
jgi:hypothetical protein